MRRTRQTLALTVPDIYGGQPLDGSSQFDDLFILSIPSFTWTVAAAANGPGPRAGHSCHLLGSQFVVVGGASQSHRAGH